MSSILVEPKYKCILSPTYSWRTNRGVLFCQINIEGPLSFIQRSLPSIITQFQDRALLTKCPTSRANFTPQANDIQVRGVISFGWEQAFEVYVRLFYGHL